MRELPAAGDVADRERVRLRDAMLAHPTMAEGLNALFASWVE